MQPIKCTQLIANWGYQQAVYERISSKFLGDLLNQGNLNGMFLLGTVGDDFTVVLKLEKVPDDMELFLKKDNEKIINLKGLLSKADMVLEEDSKVLFELSGTPVKYITSEQTLVFD